MEAIIVIAVTILFAFVLKALDYFSNRRNLKSVGEKNALDYYTDFPD